MASSSTAGDERCSRAGSSTSEKLFLLRHRTIDGCLHGGNSTLNGRAVKTAGRRLPVSGAQHFVRDIERRHHGDALGARNLPRIADLAHPVVEKLYRLQQLFPLRLLARDAVLPSENRYIEGERTIVHWEPSWRTRATAARANRGAQSRPPCARRAPGAAPGRAPARA